MGHSSARAPQPRKRAAGRRFVVITAVTWLAVLALSLLAAPIALAQTDPTDPTLPPDTTTLPPDTTTLPPDTTTLPPDTTTTLPDTTTTLPDTTTTLPDTTTTEPATTTTEPATTTTEPQTTTTRPRTTTTTRPPSGGSGGSTSPPVPSVPLVLTQVPVVPLNLSLLNFSALAKKNALKAKNAKQQSLLGTGSSIIAAPATAAATVPVANPAASPATDPEVRVAGKEATRKAVAQRLLDTSGSSGDSIWPTVALIGAVAVLPIVGAFALGSGDIRKWFRRSESDA